MEAGKAVARGRVPVISGVAEFTSAFAIDMAKEAARIGLDGVMVMPALVYSSKPNETAAHFRSVAKATDLPVMVYNNPPIYKNDVTPPILASLADCETIVCFKESSGAGRSGAAGRRLKRAVATLGHRTMALAAAEELRRRITNGYFPEGCQWKQEALAADFGMGRIPTREALLQLESEGFVRVLP